MKLSIETYVLRERFSDEAGIRMIADAGFDAADYSFYWAKGDKDVLGGDYLERAGAIRSWLDAAGIRCNQTHAPFELKYGAAFDESNPTFVRLVRSIESSAILGADNVIVHRVRVPADGDDLDYFAGFYKALEPYAKKSGVHISVENLFETGSDGRIYGSLGTPDTLCSFVRSLESEWFNCCVDIGHTTFIGGVPAQEFLAGMDGSLLASLHVHDNDLKSDQHLMPFWGKIDWTAVTKSLAAIGYAGDLTLEVFGALKKYPDALLPDALRMAAATGRHLISMIEAAK